MAETMLCGMRGCGMSMLTPEGVNKRVFFQCPRCLAVYSVYRTRRPEGSRWDEIHTHIVPCRRPGEKRQTQFQLNPEDFCCCDIAMNSWMVCPRHGRERLEQERDALECRRKTKSKSS